MAHEELAKTLTKMMPIKQEQKDYAERLLQELQSENGEQRKEAGGYVFSVVEKPKAQSLDKKFIAQAFKRYMKAHRSDPDEQAFVKFLLDERKKATARNPTK